MRASGASPVDALAGLSLTLALVGLCGCAAQSLTDEPGPVATPPAEKPPAVPAAETLKPDPLPGPSAIENGLALLPTPNQVLSSVPEGRADPFAPSNVQSVTVQGVLDVGGELRAFVKTPEGAGTVCPGLRGRCPGDVKALLPAGWVVERIEPGRGCLVVSIAGQSWRRCIT